jgi:proline dehydrogenase
MVAKKYIAGQTVDEAMQTVRALNRAGAAATVDVLGEFVKEPEVAAQERDKSIEVVREISDGGLESGLSVKLTSLGLDIDEALCRANLHTVLDVAREHGIFVRIDMENSPYTDQTLAIAREMWEEYGPRVGVVLQAYLRRTINDIADLAPLGMSVRLCKGIYIESETIAYRDRREVQNNYLRCLEALIANGTFVGIATHDDVLIDGARELLRAHELKKSQYEFQMLLGVRESVRDQLINEGHRMRVYVPFGEDWYGYSVRRLQENPQIAGHVVKALFSGD